MNSADLWNMASDETTKQAAIRLGQRLNGKPWYSSVGIAEEGGAFSLIVYSRRRLPKSETSVPESWDGLPVKVQQLGKLVPAQPAKPNSADLWNWPENPGYQPEVLKELRIRASEIIVRHNRSTLIHAARQLLSGSPVRPLTIPHGLLGYSGGAVGFVCAQCAARIIARGRSMAAIAPVEVWSGRDPEPTTACALCNAA